MKEWFVARGSKKYGPYTSDEVLQLRQMGKCFESDLVWKQGMRQWKPLILTEEFSPLAVAERATKDETCAIFNRRRWTRVRKEVSLVIHNEQNLWTGRTLMLSQGGAMIELTTPYLKAGDRVHIHLQSNQDVEINFSCQGVISGKRYSNERMRFNSTIQYSVRFEEKDDCADQHLAEWVQTTINEKLNTSKGANHVTANN